MEAENMDSIPTKIAESLQDLIGFAGDHLEKASQTTDRDVALERLLSAKWRVEMAIRRLDTLFW